MQTDGRPRDRTGRGPRGARADRRLRAADPGARAGAGRLRARCSGHPEAGAHAVHRFVQAAGRVQQAPRLRGPGRRGHRGVRWELRARRRTRRPHARLPRRDLRAVVLAEGEGRAYPGPRRGSHGRRWVLRRGARCEPRARRGERGAGHARVRPARDRRRPGDGRRRARRAGSRRRHRARRHRRRRADRRYRRVVRGPDAGDRRRARSEHVDELGDRGGRSGRRHLRRVCGGLARHKARRGDRVRHRLGARPERRPGLGRRDPRCPATALAGGPDLRGAGGATSLAALLSGAYGAQPGEHVAVVVCGANGDLEAVAGTSDPRAT